MNATPLRLGIAGFGTVGSGLINILNNGKENILSRAGRDIVVQRILVRDMKKERSAPIPTGATVTDSIDEFVNATDVDVIVELIGGVTTAKTLIEKALSAGKHVVTANKALLAETGNHLFAMAEKQGVHLRYEASVCGGIPIVETLTNSLVANTMSSMLGILNGTSNYILSEMTTKGLSFETALADAQEKGYAEADPTLDIAGGDTAHKLSLLIRLAWGVEYPFEAMPVSGITKVLPADINFAKTFGYRIKLIAHAKMKEGKIQAAVFPALVDETLLLSRVSGAHNAVRVVGDAVGSIFLHGKGAGDLPTGSAVAADVIAIARGTIPNNTGYYLPTLPKKAKVMERDAITSDYYVRLIVADQPGVMRDIASIMADNNISIAQAIQKKETDVDTHKVPFTIMTHTAKVVDMENAIAQLAASTLVHEPPTVYRVLARDTI